MQEPVTVKFQRVFPSGMMREVTATLQPLLMQELLSWEDEQARHARAVRPERLA